MTPTLFRGRTLAAPRRPRSTWLGRLGALTVLAVLVAMASLAVGARPIPPGTVLEAPLAPERTLTDHLVVLDLRLPRSLACVLVGAAFGFSGVLLLWI